MKPLPTLKVPLKYLKYAIKFDSNRVFHALMVHNYALLVRNDLEWQKLWYSVVEREL